MARGSGFNTAIKIVKAIDRAQKKAARETERQRKQQVRDDAKWQREYEKDLRQQEREDAKRQREHAQMLRQKEKEQAASDKAQAAAAKARYKQDIERSKNSYEKRCIERQNLRNKFVDQELR